MLWLHAPCLRLALPRALEDAFAHGCHLCFEIIQEVMWVLPFTSSLAPLSSCCYIKANILCILRDFTVAFIMSDAVMPFNLKVWVAGNMNEPFHRRI